MPSSKEDIQLIMGVDATPLARGIRGITSKIRQEFKGAFEGIGNQLAALFTGEKLAESIKGLAEMADRIKDVSEVTGASTDFVQGFEEALRKMNISGEASAAALEKFTVNVGEARAAGKDLEGIKLTDLAGNLKTTEQLIYEFANR